MKNFYENGASRVMTYWDTSDLITSKDDPKTEYQKYLEVFPNDSEPLTLADFEEYQFYLEYAEVIHG